MRPLSVKLGTISGLVGTARSVAGTSTLPLVQRPRQPRSLGSCLALPGAWHSDAHRPRIWSLGARPAPRSWPSALPVLGIRPSRQLHACSSVCQPIAFPARRHGPSPSTALPSHPHALSGIPICPRIVWSRVPLVSPGCYGEFLFRQYTSRWVRAWHSWRPPAESLLALEYGAGT